MSKAVVIGVMCVLFTGSSAIAGLLNAQSVLVGLDNTVAVLGGSQWAAASQGVMIGSAQQIQGAGGLTAGQDVTAAIGQVAVAGGINGLIGVRNRVTVGALQIQGVGDAGGAMQVQGLGVSAGQTVRRSAGVGGAAAGQVVALQGRQQTSTPSATMTQSATVLGAQSSRVFGGTGSGTLVNNTMVVEIGQMQGVQ